MSSRRHVLSLLAAAPFAPALTACSPPGLPDPFSGWRDPGAGEADPRRFGLAHAILAPNPHNTQPWQVELRGEDEMALYCDLDRRLPFTDPLDRQVTMGCGCFLELYRLAAAEMGLHAAITSFPEGAPDSRLDTRPVASVTLARPAMPLQASTDPLFAAITMRRTNRNIYDPERTPNDATFDSIDSAVTNTGEEYPGRVRWASGAAEVAALRDLVWRAFDKEMRTRGAQEETYRWLRFGREERARHRDGLYIDVPAPRVLRALGLLSEENTVDPDSSANQRVAADWKRKAESAPAFMWLTSVDDTPATRLTVGMAYARMNLAATAAGLAMHPWSQALQEYAEMAELYAEAKDTLGAGDDTVQMLVRVGHADPGVLAPRRAMQDFIRA